MSRGRDASSSDLERARALSRRLEQGEGAPAAPAPAPVGPGYIRFKAERFGAQAAAAPEAPPSLRVPPPLPIGAPDWTVLTAWVHAATRAEVVFMADAHGLLVALSGNMTHERAEAMGARLVVAFEHADRMEAAAGPSRALVVEFGGVTLSGLRVDAGAGESLVLGIASQAALTPTVRADVERVLAEHLAEL